MDDDIPKSAVPLALPKLSLKRFSTVLKMAAIAILILFLLIPLSMVRSVLRERLQRRDAAVHDITSTWGSEQVVFGPVLIVPYRYNRKAWKEEVINGRIERTEANEPVRGSGYFLPAAFKAVQRTR